MYMYNLNIARMMQNNLRLNLNILSILFSTESNVNILLLISLTTDKIRILSFCISISTVMSLFNAKAIIVIKQ